eukprot:SAG31_NODE_4587_length_3110_cov_3.378944_1_plen_126_part_00
MAALAGPAGGVELGSLGKREAKKAPLQVIGGKVVPVRVEESAEHGRVLTVAATLRAGEQVFEEPPILLVVRCAHRFTDRQSFGRRPELETARTQGEVMDFEIFRDIVSLIDTCSGTLVLDSNSLS